MRKGNAPERRWLISSGPLVAIVVAVLVVGFVSFFGLALRNHQAFRVVGTEFSREATAGWASPVGSSAGFSKVNYPYFLHAGYHRVLFTSNRERIAAEIYALDCVREVRLDGRLIYQRKNACKNSRFITKKDSARAKPIVLDLDLRTEGLHVLGVLNENVKGRDTRYARDLKVLWVEHEGRAGKFRLGAFLTGISLLLLVLARIRGRRVRFVVMRWLAWGRLLGFVLVLFAATILVRASVSTTHLTGDVHHATQLYVENIFHKSDWRFTELDPQYEAAKYWGKSYMHKSPGLYYQYLPARWVLGYTHLYRVYLARLPGLVGDLLIALGIWRLVYRYRRRRREADISAGLYLLSPVVFLVNGYVGRVDALPVALLLLGVVNLRKWRYSLYFGAAVGTKQLAVLAGPLLAARPRTLMKTMVAAFVTVGLMAPFLLDNAELFLERMTKPQLDKPMSGLTWMFWLKKWGFESKDLPGELTLNFIYSLPVLAAFTSRRVPIYRAMALVYVGFMLFARNVAEHYLLWCAPWLVVLMVVDRHALAGWCWLMIQVAGLLHNDRIRLVSGEPAREFALLLGMSLAVFFFTELLHVLSPRDVARRLAEAVRGARQRVQRWREGVRNDTRLRWR
ncbi:MAG: hypothetical protein AAF715_12210 [Myxococcota bacterium]